MAEIISASHDVVFKALFVRNQDILRAFLRDILDLPITDSDRIDILNPEELPESSNGKLSRLDIHVEMANRKFNIEMQARKKGIEAVYALNADTILREKIRQRDKALNDYENDMTTAKMEEEAEGRLEGRVEERNTLADKWRKKGFTEEQIRDLLGD